MLSSKYLDCDDEKYLLTRIQFVAHNQVNNGGSTMDQSSNSTQTNIDKQVCRIKRKLIASWMSSNGASLSDVGGHFGVSSSRAKQFIDYGNRRISILMSPENAGVSSITRAKISPERARFAMECDFD